MTNHVIPVVSLDSGDYSVYADVDAADEYLGATTHATTWQALTDDDVKGQALVTATRLLDRQRWRGKKTDPAQPLAWPRTDTGVAGVVDDEIPQDITSASIELASALIDGSDVQNVQNTSQKIQALRAGSVSITYFRGAEGQPIRFPMIVWELLRDYLASSLRVGLTESTGTSKETQSEEDFGFSHGL